MTLTASLLVAGTTASPAAADPQPSASPDPTTPTTTAFPRPEDPDAALRAAVAEAKKLGKPVEVTGTEAETSTTWAYPDGHLASDVWAGPLRIKDDAGTWRWIDTTLVEHDGVLKPKVAKADVKISAGGSEPFATMTDAKDRSFGLSWPTPLPRPQITGNVATYTGAAGPGADLVVTALPTGFRHDVVLRERPTGAVEFRLPVHTDDLKLSTTKTGGLSLTDDKGKDKGKAIVSAPAPLMWDAAADKPTAQQPGRQAKVTTKVVTEDGKSVLVLKPDPKWLADPATRYPVTVDPTTTLGVTQEVSVMSPSSQLGTPGSVERYRTCVANCESFFDRKYEDHVTRTLMSFDTAPIANRHVVKATLQTTLRADATSCKEFQGIVAQRLTSAWTAAGTYWSNQPSSTLEGRASVVTCNAPSSNGAVWSWNLTDMTRLWASGTPNHGISLSLATESPVPENVYESYRFYSARHGGGTVPKLSVDWVLPPEIPTVMAESIDSIDGNDAIARTTNVKVSYNSRVPEGTKLNYTVTVNDSTMPAPATQIPAGEVAHWTFDETDGATAADSSGKGFTATLQGTHSRTPGQLGRAVKLTNDDDAGSNDAYAATSGPVLATDKSYTIGGWVKLDSSTTDQTVFSQMGVNQPAFALSFSSFPTAPQFDQRWELQMARGDTAGMVSPVALHSKTPAKIGEWTHLVVQYDAEAHKFRLYVDGVLAGERDHTVTWNARGAFEIGRGKVDGSLEFLDGSVDDVHVYDRVLTGEEIRALQGVPTVTTHNDIASGQVLDKVFALDNPASFKFVVKACRAGVTPPSCQESPAYRITSDAPVLPTDTETGMADPARPILSGMVNRPSGGPVIAKYYLYDHTGAPVGSSPLGQRAVNGGERASFQVGENVVQAGRTYTWRMQACVTGQSASGSDPAPTPAPTTAPTPAPVEGLVAAYGMNEGSGTTVADASGKDNAGTIRDATWVSDGRYGNALSFGGSSSWVEITHNSSLTLTDGMTLSAWVKPDDVDSWRTVAMKDHANGSAYGLYASNRSAPSGWMLNSDASSHNTVNGSEALPVGEWSHVAVTRDGTTARLYVNGEEVGQTSVGGTLSDDGGALHIGGNTKWGEYFSGLIDEVRVYDRAQTTAQIQTDMTTPRGRHAGSRPCADALTDHRHPAAHHTGTGQRDTRSLHREDRTGQLHHPGHPGRAARRGRPAPDPEQGQLRHQDGENRPHRL
ncbi:LamG-like jellyroll fold domain-containing protein [Planomonospora algeriensis]